MNQESDEVANCAIISRHRAMCLSSSCTSFEDHESNMRRSARIFGLVQKQLPGSVLYGDFLAVGKTEMFLCGFRLFTTGRKNHNDLVRGVTPLWRPRDEPSFSFGGRYGSHIHHPKTGWTITDPRDDQRSAATVLEQITPFVDEFEGIQTVDDFLRYFDFMRPNSTPSVQLDFAIADYLSGDLERCDRGLKYVDKTLDECSDCMIDRLGPIHDEIRTRLDSDPGGLRDLLETWRRDNFERMRL